MTPAGRVGWPSRSVSTTACINRYETYILNTAQQAAVLIERIDAPNVYAHLDTYHMNIEEPSFADAITMLGRRLGYLHLAESNRGLLGGEKCLL